MSSRSKESPHITVRRAAMNLLARREQSFQELLDKLVRKYPDLDQKSVILPALEKLKEENLQCDHRFAESYVRYRYSRGFGPLKIRQELGNKGVSPGSINEILNDEGIDWYDLCHQAMAKKFPYRPSVDSRDRKKRYRFLAQRGFDSDQIMKIIS